MVKLPIDEIEKMKKVLLFTGIIVVFVMVGFLTHNSAEAREPERIVIAGGNSFEPLIFLNSDGKATA